MAISEAPDWIRFAFAILMFVGLWLYVRGFYWLSEFLTRWYDTQIAAQIKARKDAEELKRTIRKKRKADLKARRHK